MSTTKWIIGIGAVGLLTAGGIYLYRQKQAGDELEITTHPMVHTVVPFAIRVDVLMKNVTRTALKIKYPFVKLSYKGATLGTSQVSNADVTLPAFSPIQLNPPVMINIPILGLFSIGGTLLNDLQGGVGIKLDVEIKTYVHLGGSLKKIEITDQITLKNDGSAAK